MSQFICAVSTSSSDAPAAYVLAERATPEGTDEPAYLIRALGRFAGGEPEDTIKNLLADEEQYAGRATLVGGCGAQGMRGPRHVGIVAS